MIIDEEMLDYVMENIADCFDFSINYLKLKPSVFVEKFYNSKNIKLLEIGDPYFAYGISGIELAVLILNENNIAIKKDIDKFDNSKTKSADYWIGYVAAYYCIVKEISFKRLLSSVSYSDLKKYYITYHQQDEIAVTALFDKLLKKQESNLKKIRVSRGISQSELSIVSGVSVRSIQAYEQHYKDINKCEGHTLYKLARALNTSIESLLNI